MGVQIMFIVVTLRVIHSPSFDGVSIELIGEIVLDALLWPITLFFLWKDRS